MPGDIRFSSFNPSAVLLWVRALNLDFDGRNSRPFGNVKPRVTRDGERVHAISNNRLPRTQLLFCHCVRDAITGVVDLRYQSGMKELLLDRIDAKVDRTQLMSELSGDLCFSNAGESTEDDQFRARIAARTPFAHFAL